MPKREDEYIPASDEPVIEPDIDTFELLWAKHRGAIIGGAAALIILIVAGLSWVMISSARRSASEEAFAAAKTADEYRAVISQYSGSVVAGNASLLLANSLREGKKLDEANQVLAEFVKAQPEHPLVALASLAIAENEAEAGKSPEALQSLQMLADTRADSFVAPVALMLKADLALALGDRNEALKTYQALARLYPGSVAADSSLSNYNALQALARPASKKKAAESEPVAEPKG